MTFLDLSRNHVNEFKLRNIRYFVLYGILPSGRVSSPRYLALFPFLTSFLTTILIPNPGLRSSLLPICYSSKRSQVFALLRSPGHK